jgi:murein DD-endopeptidase MepM/ murein hydrolase activator NlpD
MTWSAALWRRVVLVLLLVGAGVVATGTDSAASVAPEWASSSAGAGAPAPTRADTGPAGVDAPRGRWAWPLLPRPPVLARFDPPDVRWGSGHRGVDLGASVGQSVLAPTDGVVAFRGVVVDRGVLVVTTVDGLRTTFEPVDSELAVGTPVVRAQPIGTVAATSGHCAPATCLHWGVLNGETYLNPLALVGAVRVVLLPLYPP